MYYSSNSLFKTNNKFSYDLTNLILEKGKEPLFICVGNNKIIDDSLGPIVGELLKNYYKIKNTVYGSFKKPLINNNLKQALEEIKMNHQDKTIIVIDSSIGKLENLYDISLNNNGLQINFLNNNEKIGDISISSVTNILGIHNLLIQNYEKKNMLFSLSKFIANGIFNSLNLYENLIKNNQ